MMRRFLVITGLLWILVSAVSAGAEKDAALEKKDVQWKLLVESEITHKSTIAGFCDAKNGITAGYAGECHYTEDSGKSWPIGQNTSYCRFGLEIVDAKIAWTCGNGGNVRLSKDGGRSWDAASDFGKAEPYHCRFLSFVDDKTGWIASPFGMLAKTTDGATTWNTIKLPEKMDKIAALSLLTKDIGYILDMSGVLYKTSDGGQTWMNIESGFKDASMLMRFSFPQEAMRFIDEQRGVIVACLNDNKVYASITTDGGKSWTREKIPTKVIMGALFLSRNGRILTISQNNVVRAYERSSF